MVSGPIERLPIGCNRLGRLSCKLPTVPSKQDMARRSSARPAPAIVVTCLTTIAAGCMSRSTDAAAAFDTLIHLSPNDCDARHHRADIRCDLGLWNEAIEDYTAILRRERNDADALLNRGAAYANLKQSLPLVTRSAQHGSPGKAPLRVPLT